MSKRLQVVLDDREMLEIKRAAKMHRVTVAAWVREALRTARSRVPETDAEQKTQVVRTAAKHEFPTADIDVMLAQIEQGYSVDTDQ